MTLPYPVQFYRPHEEVQSLEVEDRLQILAFAKHGEESTYEKRGIKEIIFRSQNVGTVPRSTVWFFNLFMFLSVHVVQILALRQKIVFA